MLSLFFLLLISLTVFWGIVINYSWTTGKISEIAVLFLLIIILGYIYTEGIVSLKYRNGFLLLNSYYLLCSIVPIPGKALVKIFSWVLMLILFMTFSLTITVII